MNREEFEEELLTLPIMEFAYLDAEDVKFHDRVRYICQNECERYGTSWSCPPAVGTVKECEERCRAYDTCFVFSTIAEVRDITNMEETLATRMDHEGITAQVRDMMEKRCGKVLALSTESCDICSSCAYPDGPCRQPTKMFPCVESYGIVVTDLAEKGGMSFDNGANVVTWFSAVFYNEGI